MKRQAVCCLLLLFFLSFQFAIGQAPEITHEKDDAPMRLIPAGEYQMGSPSGVGSTDETPVHTVKLSAFYIDAFEVTNAQYAKFMAETDHPAPLLWEDATLNQPNQPVVGVTWNDAQAYAAWAGKRLPTEAEWEVAARGTDARIYPWGDEFNQRLDSQTVHANVGDDADGFALAARVGSFPSGASEFGVHDLAGNAMEWLADWYAADYYQQSPLENPPGPMFVQLPARVLRGGHWRDKPADARSSKRRSLLVDLTDQTIGFRCALDVPQTPSQGHLPWDVNNDNTVNIFDLVIVGSNFGLPNPTVGDVNGDGRVNIFDLVIVGSHLGERGAIASAPIANTIRLDSEAYQRLQNAIRALESIPDAAEVSNRLRAWLRHSQSERPAQTQLLSNYPNPFNPETWLPFQLAHAAEVSIEIFDVNGRPIRQLQLGHLEPGRYTSTTRAAYWDGRNNDGDVVASGIYFYSLYAGQFQATRRMILLK